MIHKKLLSLLVLLMTAASGAWATVYNGNAQVNSEDLKVGDIIYDASINHPFKLAANRYKYQNTVQTVISDQLQNIDIDDDGLLFQKFRPVTADGQDGNAWVVIEKMSVPLSSGEAQVLLGGIIYDPNSIYPDTDAETEGAAFTTASFAMPASDATVEYELVRDMEYKVAFSRLSTRVIVKKNGQGNYELLDADALNFQLLDQIDAENEKDITNSNDITYTIGKMVESAEAPGYYRLDKTSEVSIDAFKANAMPGNYVIIAKANDTGDYDGICSSAMIKIINGYEVTVPGKEFITYFKDEPLYDDPMATDKPELYYIASVSDNQATLFRIFSAQTYPIQSETPLLIYNPTDQPKTFLLIPAEQNPSERLVYYPGFKGTATAKTTADTNEFGPWNMEAGTTYYALNGKQFVYVKNPIEVGANKCWLEVPAAGNAASGARSLNIVFSDATGVNGVIGVKEVNDGSWYDLNGRKLNAAPNRKGVYIQNGRKVVK